MTHPSATYLFSSDQELGTEELIGNLRTRLGGRASLAEFADAVMQVVSEYQFGPPVDGADKAARPVHAFVSLMDHLPIGIAVTDSSLQVRVFNRKAREMLAFPDALFEGGLPHFSRLIEFNARRGEYGPGDPEEITRRLVERARQMEPHHFERERPDGTVLDIRGEPLPGGGFVSIWTDVTARKQAEQRLQQRNAELEALNQKLETAHTQLLQSEKLASIGQLAAGVAHEINNPVGFVLSNFASLTQYLTDLFGILAAYESAEGDLPAAPAARVRAARQKADLNYLKDDIPQLLRESQDGLSRVKKIVQDLRDFSRVGGDEGWQLANLERGLDSTLNIVSNEIRYKAEVVKDYAGLPEIECLPSQINQVFLNILVNAGQAMKERGTITVRTGRAGGEVWVDIIDTGSGIAPENLKRIFDPFFTTKPVGQGTGLGLALSYGIVQKHHGRIEVDSELGRGTRFRICLPLAQPPDA